MRRTIRNFGRKAVVAALPLAVAATFASAGTASATAPVEAPQSAPIVQLAAATPAAPAAAAIAQPVAAEAAQPVTPDVAPVAAEVSQPQDIATDPNAQNHDPMANAAALGFVIGAATGAVICGITIIGIPLIPLCAVGPGLQLALVGLLVGAIAPNSVPQILP
ncbi:hypothetical protein KHQ06_04470 [Nocardia tengchongensis]|uniref:Uncharacterized protein n=1 Tax=Nocardia tengchongensis TaxID=2055889 RepID=A0ABX8CR18_9NOCA|nr:hypothetical protein [Nocardia tengchongensis]QVI22352.1 hypothetical protein KHQ06_04470 [Nocardia tengchongensis]